MNKASAFLVGHPITSVQMDRHGKSVGFISASWFSWLFRVVLVGLALYARVTSQDKVEAPPMSNLYCISECGTCPVICSPPPPPLLTYAPPPSPAVPRSPPPSAPAHAPPPLYFTYPQPLPKSPASPPPPPPPAPSTHPSSAAPPPPAKSNDAPPAGSGQPIVISGPHQYSYPYYYYYSSNASSPSSYAPFVLLVLFLHRVFSCW